MANRWGVTPWVRIRRSRESSYGLAGAAAFEGDRLKDIGVGLGNSNPRMQLTDYSPSVRECSEEVRIVLSQSWTRSSLV